MRAIAHLICLLLLSRPAFAEKNDINPSTACNCRTLQYDSKTTCTCPTDPPIDPRRPKSTLEVGFSHLSFEQNKKRRDTDIEHSGKPYFSIQIRLLDFIYLVGRLGSYSDQLSLKKTFYSGEDDNINLAFKADLHSERQVIMSYGLRIIPWSNKRFMLHLSALFTEQETTAAILDSLDVTREIASVSQNLNKDIGTEEMLDSINFEYKLTRLDTELKLDASLGKFTPYLAAGLIILETDINITYGQDVEDRVAEFEKQLHKELGYEDFDINLPKHYNKIAAAPVLGIGSEFHIYGPASLVVNFVVVPYIGDTSFWAINGGIILRGYK